MKEGVEVDLQTEQAPEERKALDGIEARLGSELAVLSRLERALALRVATSFACGLTPQHRARAMQSGFVIQKRLAEQRRVVEELSRDERAAHEEYVDAVRDVLSRAKRAK